MIIFKRGWLSVINNYTVVLYIILYFAYLKPTWTEEMSQGLFAEDSKDEDERESDTNEGACVVPVRAVDAKTKRQRRKQKEHWERASTILLNLRSGYYNFTL